MKSDTQIAQELYDKWIKKYPMIKFLGSSLLTELEKDITQYTTPFRVKIQELEKGK
jgi:hypothetical protein